MEKQKLAPMRRISIEEDVKRYFAHVAAQDADGCRALKTGYILGLLELCLDQDESEMLVVSVEEMVQLMREAMEVKR